MVFPGEPKAKKSKVKGSLEDLKAFAVSLGLPESDGENCFHKWESTGWQGIKDWKAKMRTWQLEGYHASQKGNSGSQGAVTADGSVIIAGRAYK